MFEAANLASLPDHVVKQFDPDLHRRIQGRGAMRFRCVEADTMAWFQLRFPDEALALGDWFAIDDSTIRLPAGRSRSTSNSGKWYLNLAHTTC